MKLNVGCAEYYCDGWTNIDIIEDDGEKGIGRRPDVIANAWDLPFEDGSVDRIYTGHMLEHVPLDVAQACVAEFVRVLRTDGDLMILGPDVVLEAECVYRGGRARGGGWSYPTDHFRSEHMAHSDWEAWTFFWGVHATSGIGTLYPNDWVMGPGYKHQWNCTLEALQLLVMNTRELHIVDASYDAFTYWENRMHNGWEPIVSGADGQALVHARKM